MTATPGPGTPAAAAGPRPCRRSPLAPTEKDRTDANVRMAVTVEEAPWLGWIVAKALMRFAFMVANNLVAIPSYICYVIILQPLRVLDSKRFWYIEGLMYKWLLGMVASWGWYAGYTVFCNIALAGQELTMKIRLRLLPKCLEIKMCPIMPSPHLMSRSRCLQVVAQMMWLMDHIFKYTNFGIVSLIHGDFFIRQGRAYRDQQLLVLKKHLEHNYRSRDRKWIVLFPEGGFLRKRRETSQAFAKKNNLPFLTHVTLPRFGATNIILKALVARQENGSPAGGDARGLECKSRGLQWIIDTTIAYPKAEPIDIQTWILGYRKPTVTHVHYRIFPIADVPLETEDLTSWLYQRFIEKEDLLSHFYKTGAFPPLQGQKEAVSREMTLSNVWIVLIQSFAFLSGYLWYHVIQYFYHCLF
ncbi:acyl-CoA:lysophosphatidylglycerol acyltransferase 1 [Grammomys surdaster]|uniref:acyl-CoA:lysophosphatidylglycerol acyltransferase 1 n=1 Tax=Grammomys surdaster TaxID=491861 RepID=UPI00109FBCFE|nr:acyl-CoA:lysophosphatidylglycerol acyltransferase 1 [Grammomys surdaster]